MLSPHLPVWEACTFTLDSSDSSTATTNIVTFDLLFIFFYFIGFYLIFTTAAPPIDALCHPLCLTDISLVSTAYCLYVTTHPFASALNS